MNICKHIKRLFNDSFKSKWSRYNATESEVIVKAERNEHPHCEDHHPELHKKEFNKIINKIKNPKLSKIKNSNPNIKK